MVPIDVHISWHDQVVPRCVQDQWQAGATAARAVGVHTHAGRKSAAERRREIPDTKQNRVRPSELKGVGRLLQSCLFLGQFEELPPIRTHDGESVVLDAEAENFRDDAIFANVYLVEPGAEDRIPVFLFIRARILHLDKRTTPWLAVELFQQAAFDGRATEALREWERQMALCSKRFGCPE